MSDIVKLIGENIRTIRKAQGLSQEQLALRADINASYMGQVERGEKNPTIDVLNKIASALHRPLSELVTLPAPIINDEDSEKNIYFEKITHQIVDLSMSEQKEIYKIIKQVVNFKELKSK
ncbi:helix-turn-helix domain-containing protein [Paenibacillus yanchengensis]|uniref:Helix-turn-helix domain-containing protein n=1 Tax=Paenibacillus yanchengensis TaxID=2035833 RepID=A0ABW4YLC6_9BACL